MERQNSLNNIKGIQKLTIVGTKDIRKRKDQVELFNTFSSSCCNTCSNDSQSDMEQVPQLLNP